MKKYLILIIAAFMFTSCQNIQTINKDPKARYLLADKTLTSVFNSLVHLRKTKIINNVNDWKRIQVACSNASKAMDYWAENVKSKTDIKNPNLEVRAQKLLTDLQIELKKWEALSNE